MLRALRENCITLSGRLLLGALLLGAVSAPVPASPAWIPRGVASTHVTTETMLARLSPYADGTTRVEQYRVAIGGEALDATVHERGADYRVDTTIEGNAYAMGRSDGKSWRRTPTGTVRVIRSDVQGDDLDRWPRSLFGFYADDCAAAGQAKIGGADIWVLYCRAAGDIAHFYFVDSSSGRIVREVTREGARVATYTFESAAGGERPTSWSIQGAGPDETVSLVASARAAVSDQDVAMPTSVPEQFTLPPGGVAVISASFGSNGRITIPVVVSGRRLKFWLDTGTTQMLMDVGAASRAGLRITAGHTVANDVRIGSARASNFSVETVDLFGDTVDGLLGNEFFTGHIVHLDYLHHRVEMIAHERFVAPADAREVPLDASEGMPIISASVSGARADRIALDSAGPNLLGAAFIERTRTATLSDARAPWASQYLEGGMEMRSGSVGSIDIGPYAFPNVDTEIEVRSAEGLDIPLDGIIGVSILDHFEWWFDYDGGHLWVRQ